MSYAQTAEQEQKAIRQMFNDIARGFASFSKNMDKQAILKHFSPELRALGALNPGVSGPKIAQMSAKDPAYKLLDMILQDTYEKNALGDNIGFLIKIGDIEYVHVAGQSAFAYIKNNKFRAGQKGAVIMQFHQDLMIKMGKVGNKWVIEDIGFSAFIEPEMEW